MRDWYLQESVNKETGNKEVYVVCGDVFSSKKKIYPDPKIKGNVELYILYNNLGKTAGYLFCYMYDKEYPRFSTYNSFGVIYNAEDPEEYEVEIIFEDSNIRLLAYEHSNKKRDYFLVGRWRNVTNGNENVLRACTTNTP